MENSYRFDVYSYGHLVESKETTNLEDAKNLFMHYSCLDEVGFKLYKNNNLVPYTKMKPALGIDSKYVFEYYKNHSPNFG